MPATDFWEIVGWALACSVPVVLAGALIIRLARSWSLAVSMVALVLNPAARAEKAYSMMLHIRIRRRPNRSVR